MDITVIVDFILHVDKYLEQVIQNFGLLSYVFIFLIIFVETGAVIMPFLPGDSFLFITGALSVGGGFNIWIAYPLLLVAAISGDSLNYYLGHKLGRRAFKSKYVPFINQDHLEKTEAFYEKHGGKTIIIARFIPIIRTFAPFVAGIGKMNYREFFSYNVIGGFAWVTAFIFAGYFFGNIPVVEKNFTLVIFAIIILSILPPIWEYLMTKKRSKEGDK